ncbi:MAG: PilZ domain-containing protein [Candidatus Eisenbacteria bacterium]
MEEKKPFVERRQSHRVEARVPVQLKESEEPYRAEMLPAESANLSEGGVYCEVGKHLPPLTKVAVTMLLPAFGRFDKPQEIKAEAVVVRSLPEKEGKKVLRYRIGCAFTSLGEEERGTIREYVIWKLLSGLRGKL